MDRSFDDFVRKKHSESADGVDRYGAETAKTVFVSCDGKWICMYNKSTV